ASSACSRRRRARPGGRAGAVRLSYRERGSRLMSVPDNASAVAPGRPRPLRRAAELAAAHPIALGVVFLLLCGGKFAFGLAGVMDIDADHETAYLDYLLGSYSGAVPAEYSPLYVALYAIEHWFARDPIDLFYLNMT